MSLLEKLQSISNSKKIMFMVFILTALSLMALAIGAMVSSKPILDKPKPVATSSSSASEVVIVNPELVTRGRKIYYEFCAVNPSESQSQRKIRLAKYMVEGAQIPDSVAPSEIKSRDCVFYEGGGIFLESNDSSILLQIHAKQIITYTNGSKETKEVYAKMNFLNETGIYKISDISY